MKYIGRILVIVLCAAVAIAFAFLSKMLPERSHNEWISFSTSDSNLKLVNESSAELKQADKIKIDLSLEEIVLMPTEKDIVEVKEYINYDPADNDPIVIDSDGSIITIRDTNVNHNWFPQMNKRKKIEIYLPDSFEQNLDIDLKSGELEATMDLKLKNFDIELSSGDIELLQVTAEKTIIDVKSGHLTIEKLDSEQDVQVSSGYAGIKDGSGNASYICFSGDIEVTNQKGVVEAEVSSGEIDLTLGEASGSFKTSSGSLSADIDRVTGDLEMDVTSGDVEVNIPEDTTFEFEGNIRSGSIDTYFDCDGDEHHMKA
ncbi:MAG: DUF4097 domain-containing protein, partial [Clostridia bacterium]|nr:DUF4097 domain-containing protein [Clostridia bacterium]